MECTAHPPALPLPIAALHSARTPWWLWGNLLSLDAPSVAVAWLILFARESSGKVSPVAATALALAVWIVYVSDRLLDGWAFVNGNELRERHRFCIRHRTALSCLLLLGFAALLWLVAEKLNTIELRAGLKLAAIVSTYIVLVHLGRRLHVKFLPKEMIVGLLFALGTTLPVWSEAVRISSLTAFAWLLFAFLCSLNCFAIESWENPPVAATPLPGTRSALWRKGAGVSRFAMALSCIALAAYLVKSSQPSFANGFLAISLAAALLLLLNSCRSMFPASLLRVLADLALLIPPLIVVGLRV